MFCAPTVVLLATVESNSRIDAPEIVSVPASPPCRRHRPLEVERAGRNEILPLFVTFGVMMLVPVPPVFSMRPASEMDDEVERPCLIPLSSRMFQVPVEAMISLAMSPAASPTVAEPPLSVSAPKSSKIVVPPMVRPEAWSFPWR